MYIEEIILEGFKSYATRTVISGWDPEFNAITGLNGSGKSNILDAICFVLGITNLKQVSSTFKPHSVMTRILIGSGR
jgi:structural maintenance of chromosome 2